jgi:uncharacterized protein
MSCWMSWDAPSLPGAWSALAPQWSLLAAYRDLVEVVAPAQITPTVIADPDDDAVLACALAGHADLIVSGDAHLLNLKRFHHIRILTVREALELIAQLRT